MNETAMTALLAEADACHDDDPARAAELLRRIDAAALPPARWPGLAFLLNHVLGEKLGAWGQAQTAFDLLLRARGAAPSAALLRQAATAARMAGDAAAADRWSKALAEAAGVALGPAQDAVALTAAMYRAPGMPAAAAADAVKLAFRPFATAAWHSANALDAAVAACASNIASSLVERPPAELRPAALRAVLDEAAQLAERFWLRAGNWVNHERAAYLRAMVANALGDAAQARAHSLRALALLDAHDTERAEQVDRAFIALEHAHACRELALADEAQQAQQLADAIAAQFGDAELDAWFAARRATLAALRA